MAFKIKIEPEARLDIQEAIDWYNNQEQGLGRKFHTQLLKRIESLSKNPYFEIRFDSVRCLPMKKFPFMIHFTLDETQNCVVVHAVFHTSLNPKNWEER